MRIESNTSRIDKKDVTIKRYKQKVQRYGQMQTDAKCGIMRKMWTRISKVPKSRPKRKQKRIKQVNESWCEKCQRKNL